MSIIFIRSTGIVNNDYRLDIEARFILPRAELRRIQA
jgi:hypothetical protein